MLKNMYIFETKFCARGKKYYILIPHCTPYLAVTILTKEQYQEAVKKGEIDDPEVTN